MTQSLTMKSNTVGLIKTIKFSGRGVLTTKKQKDYRV